MAMFVGLLNMLGVGPQYDNHTETWKTASKLKKIILGSYASICVIGYGAMLVYTILVIKFIIETNG